MAKLADIAGKRAVRGSRTDRPVMALLGLLSRRWTLRIWELRDGPLVMQARLSKLREPASSATVTASRRWAEN
jgi:hypothetical protein